MRETTQEVFWLPVCRRVGGPSGRRAGGSAFRRAGVPAGRRAGVPTGWRSAPSGAHAAKRSSFDKFRTGCIGRPPHPGPPGRPGVGGGTPERLINASKYILSLPEAHDAGRDPYNPCVFCHASCRRRNGPRNKPGRRGPTGDAAHAPQRGRARTGQAGAVPGRRGPRRSQAGPGGRGRREGPAGGTTHATQAGGATRKTGGLGRRKRRTAREARAVKVDGGDAQIRTGGRGFAGPCLTTWPRRHMRRAGMRPARIHMERTTGLEPATPTLARWCSTN